MMRRNLLGLLTCFGLSCVAKPTLSASETISTRDAQGRDYYAHGKLDKLGTRLCYARLQVSRQMQRAFQSFSTCGRCELPWSLLREHVTVFGDKKNDSFDMRDGIFVLCEDCWTELMKPEYRMPYYMAIIDQQAKDYEQYKDKYPRAANPETQRAAVRQAVLSEPITDAKTMYSFGSFDE